jgi:hypothetical protein
MPSVRSNLFRHPTILAYLFIHPSTHAYHIRIINADLLPPPHDLFDAISIFFNVSHAFSTILGPTWIRQQVLAVHVMFSCLVW